MRSTSLPQARRTRKAAPAAPEVFPDHLNFSFPDWFRQRTELPRTSAGWTPVRTLHNDYVLWCAANAVPEAYVHDRAAFEALLGSACGRSPETRKIVAGSQEAFEPCYPRFLMRPIRVSH